MTLYGLPQLVDSVRTVRRNTILIAEDIPAEKYGYRPTPDSRSVAETLIHIALLWKATQKMHGGEQRLATLEGVDFGRLIGDSRGEERRSHGKEEILDLLRTSGEEVCQWLAALPESVLAEEVRMPGGTSKLRFEVLLGAKEHEMHHRAQLTVLERLVGIVPHLTRRLAPVADKPAA